MTVAHKETRETPLLWPLQPENVGCVGRVAGRRWVSKGRRQLSRGRHE